MHISRREALKWGLAGTGSLLFPFSFAERALALFSPQIKRFEVPLPIPKTLEPLRRDDTFDYYQVTLQKRRLEILPGLSTEVWTYNGTLPGPLIRQPKLRQSVVRFINQLGQDPQGKDIKTTVHLHGMASLPQYDGYAEDLIPPGYYKDYFYPNNRAATLWYHDHAVGKTSRNVYMGLAGMYVVDYAPNDFVNPDDRDRLPQGEYDIPLIIQDKIFASDGSLVFADRGQISLFGDVILVNGAPWPRLEVANRKYRFRVLNASASRTYQLALSRDEQLLTKGDTFSVIASDAGLLSEPVELGVSSLAAFPKPLRVGVAERYEFVIDFSKYPLGTQVFLRNIAPPSAIDSDTRSQVLMRFDVVRQAADDSSIPRQLGKVKPIQELLANKQVRTRTFRFQRSNNQWLINGRGWDPKRVEANPNVGDVEIWNLVNPGGGWVHPVHVHLVDLRLIDRNGVAPLAYEQGWKDVFYVSDNQTVRVVAEFGPHRGKYMIHCHNLVHEDHDMMTQFEVGQGGPDPVTTAPAQPIANAIPL